MGRGGENQQQHIKMLKIVDQKYERVKEF